MRPRAIKDLTQLADAELFVELARGMRLCLVNALRLWRDARRLLVANRPQGFNILCSCLEEEAAKFHILLDAVRCPRQSASVFSRQLDYFNQHLAKGLYARYYDMFSPADLAEIRRHIDGERKALYLDGPNDVDWVFRNDILRKREEAVYVDYVAYADSSRNEHYWHCPDTRLMRLGNWSCRPRVLEVALALHGIGVTDERALAMVADLWRNAPMDDSIKWPTLRERNLWTIEMLDQAQLLRSRPKRIYALVAEHWLFPLFPLDLTEERVSLADLSDAQRAWYPPDS